MAKKSFTSDQNLAVLRKGKKYPTQNAILNTKKPQPKDLLYTNSEMRKAMQQVKEKPGKIKIISGSASTREQLATSSKRSKSMVSSGLPKTTNSSKKTKPSMPRATKRGTPVPLPKKPGNIATGSKKTARPKPAGKITKKPRKPITERQFLDVPNMTPAEKAAYLRRGKRGY